MQKLAIQKFSRRFAGISAVVVFSVLGSFKAQGGFNAQLEGQNTNSSTWISVNLMGWKELDYIPCRVLLTGGPANNKTITVQFDHFHSKIPGIENLTSWAPSTNVVITSGPTLNAPIGSMTWSYTFTINLLNTSPGWVEFRARLSAGAHLNSGSSLALSGSPSLGTLQIHKPDAGVGIPDLAILKSGVTNAA